MAEDDELPPLGRFYRSLLDLNVDGAPQEILEQALRLLVELTGASVGYIEVVDQSASSPLCWWAVLGCDERHVTEIQRTVSHGIVAQALAQGEVIATGSAVRDPRFADRESVRDNEIEAVLCAPVGRGEIAGVVYLQGDPTSFKVASERTQRHVSYFGRTITPFLRASLARVAQHEPAATGPFAQLIFHSQAMSDVVQRLQLVAPLDVDLLFSGATGVGKSLLARAVHGASRRVAGAFVELNCAAVPEPLFENELFGAEEGAHSSVPRGGIVGKVEAAEGGTLFLDEVAELTLAAQAKLLSLLQSRTYYPLGASRPRHADIRVIAASNVDLRSEVARKRFREDLYYRLNVMEVRVPPLSERVEDIPLLAARFVRVAAQRHGLGLRGLSPGGLRAVLHADWPGNVRELAHRLEAAVLNAHLRGATTVEARDVFDDGATDDEDGESLQEATRRFQKRYVLAALEACDWNVSEAARRLDVARSHAYNLMRLYGLERRS